MSDMRRLMMLVESENNAPVQAKLQLLMRKLGTWPHGRMTFDSEWAAIINRALAAAKATHEQVQAAEVTSGDLKQVSPWSSEMTKDWLRDRGDHMLARIIGGYSIRKDAAKAEADYQARMASTGDAYDMVEDSDVLRFLAAQRAMEASLWHLLLSAPKTWEAVLEAIERCMLTADHAIQDEALLFIPSVEEIISKLLPLMAYVLLLLSK